MDKEVVRGGMPKRFENARIALVNSPLEVEKPDAKLNINNPSQMQKFLDEENNMLNKISSASTNSNWNSALRSYALRVKYSLYL